MHIYYLKLYGMSMKLNILEFVFIDWNSESGVGIFIKAFPIFLKDQALNLQVRYTSIMVGGSRTALR